MNKRFKKINENQLRSLISNLKLVFFDFDGVFTDNTVYVSQDGIESIRCWRSDGIGLGRLRKAGVISYIISTETNPVVAVRAEKLAIPCKHSVENKAETILKICKELDVDPKFTMFVGNDINDVPAYDVVGIPVAVADSYPEVWPYIIYRTNKSGGFGAVREICDLIVETKKNKVI